MGMSLRFSLFYVPSKIVVSGDAAANAKNILKHEALFLAGMVGHLYSAIVFTLLVLGLYKLFKSVGENRARLMVAVVVVQIPIVFLIETLNLRARMHLKGEILKAAGLLQYQNFSMLLIRTSRYEISILELFWRLWLSVIALWFAGLLVGFYPPDIGHIADHQWCRLLR